MTKTTIEQLFLSLCLFAGSAFAECVDLGKPHAISGNFSADLYGPEDTRPGTYGHADYVIWKQPFQNVPAGCRVQVLRVSGDLIAWPMGASPAGTFAGVLVGANRTSMGASTRAPYAADGCFFYYQDAVSLGPVRIPINQKVTEGYLDSDNTLQWKVAEFLNTTGLTIHMEITFSQVVFRYTGEGVTLSISGANELGANGQHDDETKDVDPR